MLETDRDLDDAGIDVLAAAEAALGHVDVRLDQLAQEDEDVAEQRAELGRVEEPEGFIVDKESGGEQSRREAHDRTRHQLLRLEAPGEQEPEHKAEEEGGYYRGEFCLGQENPLLSGFFIRFTYSTLSESTKNSRPAVMRRAVPPQLGQQASRLSTGPS